MQTLWQCSLASARYFGTVAVLWAAASAGAAGAPAAVAAGAYECWANGSARMLLNFTVTAPGKYTASDGSKSSFSYDPASGKLSFQGYMKDVMPDGFSTVYHENKGRPTVSFRGKSGGEASYCERVGK